MVIRQNGQYYGLFTFVEDTDDQFLMVSYLLQQQHQQHADPALPCPAQQFISEAICALSWELKQASCNLHRPRKQACLASFVVQRNGLSTDGPMVKALDGVYANLRWDIGVSSYPFYWETLNHKDAATATYQLLSNFAVGVAGGGGISRADYIYDNVNLPEVSGTASEMCGEHFLILVTFERDL